MGTMWAKKRTVALFEIRDEFYGTFLSYWNFLGYLISDGEMKT